MRHAAPSSSNPKPARTGCGPARRGAAFIVALLVVTMLAGVVLIFARGMNASAGAARADVSQTQARWIAQGAIEAIRGELAEKIQLGEVPRLDVVGVQAEPMGDGLYWVIGRDLETGEPGVGAEEVAFGLVGEGGKFNLNQVFAGLDPEVSSAFSEQNVIDFLRALPMNTRGLVSDINRDLAGLDFGSEAVDDPAEVPADPASVPEERGYGTVDQTRVSLLRSEGISAGAAAGEIEGEDLNRNGVLDPNEDDGDASPPADNADGRLDFGLREYLTVYSVERLTADNGQPRINVNRAGQGLDVILEDITTASRYNELVNTIPPARPFSNLPDFFVRSQITEDEFAQIHDQLMVEDAGLQRIAGKIDLYQASAGLLDALPGLEPGDGAAIVAARPT
ncbi:MAG: hypothetical protein AAGL98_11785, partial [Planctomycetota bacterium]